MSINADTILMEGVDLQNSNFFAEVFFVWSDLFEHTASSSALTDINIGFTFRIRNYFSPLWIPLKLDTTANMVSISPSILCFLERARYFSEHHSSSYSRIHTLAHIRAFSGYLHVFCEELLFIIHSLVILSITLSLRFPDFGVDWPLTSFSTTPIVQYTNE